MRSLLALTMVAAALACAGVVALAAGESAADEPTPYVDRVVEHKLGDGGGFGEKMLPDVVLGPPHGNGKFLGGSDVLSLGDRGTITLEFVDNELVDEPGPDLIVFENAFLEKPGDDPGRGNFELAKVEVSFDGKEWLEFPYDATHAPGLRRSSSRLLQPRHARGERHQPGRPGEGRRRPLRPGRPEGQA